MDIPFDPTVAVAEVIAASTTPSSPTSPSSPSLTTYNCLDSDEDEGDTTEPAFYKVPGERENNFTESETESDEDLCNVGDELYSLKPRWR